MTYGHELSKTQNILWVVGVVLIVVLLAAAMTQPLWNAKNMINQQETDCKKVGGVEIIDHGTFGDTYSCEPRLDRGVAK